MKHLPNWNAKFIPREFRMATAVLLTMSAAAAILFFRNDRADRTNPPDPITRRVPRTSPAFWTSARIPAPVEEIPISVIRPEDLGIVAPTSPIDHPARIARAISENDLPAVQSAALSWFEQDPTAARDWLAMQSTYDDLQPAIRFIASRISEKGDLNTALAWTNLLPDGTLRDDTLFDIHALALRNGKISVSEITSDAIPPDRHAELLSGAAGD